jgi:hypothetical protein
MHHVDGGVDALDALELVRDEVLDGQLAREKLVHQLGNLVPNINLQQVQTREVFKVCTNLSARFEAPKGGALPGAPSDELEGSSGDLVTGGGHTCSETTPS